MRVHLLSCDVCVTLLCTVIACFSSSQDKNSSSWVTPRYYFLPSLTQKNTATEECRAELLSITMSTGSTWHNFVAIRILSTGSWLTYKLTFKVELSETKWSQLDMISYSSYSTISFATSLLLSLIGVEPESPNSQIQELSLLSQRYMLRCTNVKLTVDQTWTLFIHLVFGVVWVLGSFFKS